MRQHILHNLLRDPLVQNMCAILVVSVFVLALSPQKILTLFIILGQAHFALTYLYQHRAGKLTRQSIIAQVLFLAFLFVITSPALYPWLLVIAGTLFCIHYFQDEIKMFGETPSAALFLSGCAVTAAYFAFLANAAFPTFEILPHALAVGTLFLLGSFFVVLNEDKKPTVLHYYFAILYLGFFLLWVSAISVPVESLLGSIILLHYVRWYIFYYWKLVDKGTERWKYVQKSIAVNIFVFLLYIASLSISLLAPIYTYFFTPLFFFSWTILHILFSIRKDDYAFIPLVFSKK